MAGLFCASFAGTRSEAMTRNSRTRDPEPLEQDDEIILDDLKNQAFNLDSTEDTPLDH